MSKPVEVEFLMKDNLTTGMNKAEREALELRNYRCDGMGASELCGVEVSDGAVPNV